MEFNRVRKPPGGDTNDIFRLEERQKCQRSEHLLKKGSDNVTEKSHALSPSKAVESSFTRVRKPPGGDTNDIFGMERRQKSDALKQQQICEEKEDSLDKENLTLPDLATEGSVCDEDTILKVKLLEKTEEDPDESSMKYYRHNTITGEVREMNLPMRHKLKDCSNVSEQEEKAPVQRSNIRVRQPPGGTSNIFF